MQIFGTLSIKISSIFYIYLYKLGRSDEKLVWRLWGNVSDYSEEDANKRLEDLLRLYGGYSAHNMGAFPKGKLRMVYLYEEYPIRS